ncbi:MAG: laccase domain-containing protein [Chthoniobacteraceae bacterium]
MTTPAPAPVEFFPALGALARVRHAFVQRVPGLDVKVEREEALQRLARLHEETRAVHGFAGMPLINANQVHGREVGLVKADTLSPVQGVDALITNQPYVNLGIYVADCCAIYFVDPVRRAIGLAHSGKKGTELGITTAVIEAMRQHFGSEPGNLVIQLSPCIRPPDYEVDFAAEIVRQARATGVQYVHDCGISTASDLERYYSYRVEKGKTGRLLALLALT